MKILALLDPKAGRTMVDFQPLFVAEEKAVWAAYRAGTLREMYFQPDPIAVSLMFEAAGTTEVEAVLRTFPMIEAGLLDVRLVTLGPWMPLEALFDPSHRS